MITASFVGIALENKLVASYDILEIVKSEIPFETCPDVINLVLNTNFYQHLSPL